MTEVQETRDIGLIGVAMDHGAGISGARMGPAALRCAGIVQALASLGHRVTDLGDVAQVGANPDAPVMIPQSLASVPVSAEAAEPGQAFARHILAERARPEPDCGENADSQAMLRHPDLVAQMIDMVRAAGRAAFARGDMPVFLGGDHALAAGSVAAAADHARAEGRTLAVVWLDAHGDFNTPATSPSGNMHGMPVAALTGDPSLGFLVEGLAPLDPSAFRMFGLRSIDPEERRRLRAQGIRAMDMRRIDEVGVAPALHTLIEDLSDGEHLIHVSFDADFLDPLIAPGVSTAVPGGATYREAHLVMELLAETGLVCSADLVELNPFMDHAGQTARLMVDLTASLFGRTILES